jgi:hypothetical protein
MGAGHDVRGVRGDWEASMPHLQGKQTLRVSTSSGGLAEIARKTGLGFARSVAEQARREARARRGRGTRQGHNAGYERALSANVIRAWLSRASSP